MELPSTEITRCTPKKLRWERITLPGELISVKWAARNTAPSESVANRPIDGEKPENQRQADRNPGPYRPRKDSEALHKDHGGKAQQQKRASEREVEEPLPLG